MSLQVYAERSSDMRILKNVNISQRQNMQSTNFVSAKQAAARTAPSGMPIIFLDLYIQPFKAGFGNFASGSGQQSEHQHPEKQHKELGG